MMAKNSKKNSASKSRKLPAVINRSTQQNGDPIYDVQTATSVNFASTYSKEHVVNTLTKSIIDFYKAVVIGGAAKDTPFENFKVKLHSKEEQKSAEEAWETLLYFSERASLLFEHALPLKLADLPEQLITEVFISVVQEMQDNDVFIIEGGRAGVWDNYTNVLGRTLKRSWNKTIPRGTKYWTPEKRAGLLKLYTSALTPIQGWWKKYHSSVKARRRKPTTEEKKEAAKNYPTIHPYFDLLYNTPPNQLALEYVSDVTGIESYESLRAQISKARKEAKQCQKKEQ